MFRNICVVTLLYLVFVAGQDIVPDDPEVQKEMHQMFYKARVACADENLVPYANVLTFNSTGALPDETDKTSMCYFHCFFEKSGLMKDYKLNADLVRKYVWPATGDSLEVCENEAKEETNACERGYAIVKCVFIRSLTDARNKPTV
ncbi:Odorant-binding protein 84a, isoform B [Drosophila ananassae]|uniref:Odorant-binding protein 84a, isoform B n=1 Tax=Drosophila ananassae TaxID=7217 RepID=A0A0N8P1A4_DROAN|nr:general odorant-binding protein 84a isoform X1 [Drosophila ananassae]KPU79372.1 Odorant-binding protein 84a, isoform B [Drosophila ananassae]